jgi:hypothetical protein
MTSAPVPRIELSTLNLGSRLGKGGQGQVSEVSNIQLNKQWHTVLKEYSPEAKQKLHVAALETIAGFPATLPHQDGQWLHETTAWPAAVVQDHGAACGFLMRAVPPAFYFDYQTQTRGAHKKIADVAFLLNPETYVRSSGIAITDRDRLRLLRSVAAVLSRLHDFRITVGDFSPKNLLFSLTPAPSCFLIDCDAVQLRGSSVLAQVETPDWEAPDGEPRATAASDVFKFGLLAIRLFAHDQSSRDTTALAAVSPELGRLAQLSQHHHPRQRPSPATWMTALNTAVLSATAATTRRPATPRPTATPPRISVPIPTTYPAAARPGLYPRTARPAAPPAAAAAPPRRARRRPGGPLLLAALVIALAAGIGVVVHNAIKSGASAPPSAAIGDSCLVGTWRHGKGLSSTTWDGHYVAMHGGGGDIDHISANGTDEDTWGAQAKPLYGTYQGHTLKEILHGQNILAIHVTRPGHLSVAESGWSTESTNKFIYEGRTYPASVSRHGAKSYYAYECTTHKFKWRVKNRTVDREARISGTP